MGLRRQGVELVVKGLATFTAQMGAANKSIMGFQDRIDRFRTTAFKGAGLESFIPSGVLDRLRSAVPLLSGISSSISTLEPSMTSANSLWNQLNIQMARGSTIWESLNKQISGSIQPTNVVGSLWSRLDGQVASLTGQINLMSIATGAAITVLAALSIRGAALTGIVEAFDVGARSASTFANVLLGDLREASRGTISDINMMRMANLALAGTESEVAQALGKGGLAGLLEIARAQSRATGQSVNYLFESLTLGIKRTSPRLIDNTGLVIGETQAYEWYAQKLGKAANQLSEVEKQLAILNFTLEKGKAAVDTYGKSALQASERLARIQTTIANTLDRASLAIQPLFSVILAVGESLLRVVLSPLQLIIPVVYALTKAVGDPLLHAFEGLIGIMDTFAPVADVLHRWLVVIVGSIKAIGQAFDWLVGQLLTIFSQIAGVIKGSLVKPIANVLDPTTFAKLGGIGFGALAEGILWAANTFIFPAIIMIAEFIADFLCGTSPPPKGPLHTIDQGGANTMLAWLEGFTGVPLTPVGEMAQRVSDELGSIRFMSHNQVERALAGLDKALQPFIDNLEVVKAKFEAILEPIQMVQDALEKKLNRALDKFFKGEVTAEAVRAIDQQMEAVEGRIGLFEDLTYEAEYQLSLMKAQQALQRALLEIQLRRTEAAEDETEATQATGKEAAGKKAKEPSGKAETEPTGGTTAFPSLSGDAIGAFLGVSDDEIKALAGEMGKSFTEGFELTAASGQLAKAQENVGKLTDQLGRISDTKGFKLLQDAFDKVFGTGEGSLYKTFSDFLGQFNLKWDEFKGLFDEIDPLIFESIGTALALMVAPTIIAGLWGLTASAAAAAASLTSLTVASILSGLRIVAVRLGLVAASGTAASAALLPLTVTLVLLAFAIYAYKKNLGGFADDLNRIGPAVQDGDFMEALDALKESIFDIPKALAQMALDALGVDIEVNAGLDNYRSAFENLKTIVSTLAEYFGEQLSGVPDTVREKLIDPFTNALDDLANMLIGGDDRDVTFTFSGLLKNIPTMIKTFLYDLPNVLFSFLLIPWKDVIKMVWDRLFDPNDPESLLGSVSAIPGEIPRWLAGLKEALETYFYDPIKGVIDNVLDEFGAIKDIILEILGLAGGETTPVDTRTEEQKRWDELAAAYGGPEATAKIFGPRPKKRGGRVLRGLPYIVGEEGWELFKPDQSGQILSHSQAQRWLSQMLGSVSRTRITPPAPHVQYIPAGAGGSTTYHTDRSTSVQAQFVSGDNPQNIRMRMAALRAWAT